MESYSLHKDKYIEEYTESISHHSNEKFQIFEYIKNEWWVYLEIWPWSISVQWLSEELSKNNSILYVWDISTEILKKYCKTNNIINTNSRIRPLLINTESLRFVDNSLNAIWCSAVFHEIFSYNGWGAFEKTIEEITRCLKLYWAFVYRDPRLCPNHKQVCQVKETKVLQKFLKLYVEFIHSYEQTNEINERQKSYFNAIKKLFLNKEDRLSLMNIYELKRHFVLYTTNVLWSSSLDSNVLRHKQANKVLSEKNEGHESRASKSKNWFLREWFELYYYLSTEELIIYIIETLLHNWSDYLLIPMIPEKLQFINRGKYNDFIHRNLICINSETKNRESLFERKSIIHFFKVSKSSAVPYLLQICKQQWFIRLRSFIDENIHKFTNQKIHQCYHLDL